MKARRSSTFFLTKKNFFFLASGSSVRPSDQRGLNKTLFHADLQILLTTNEIILPVVVLVVLSAVFSSLSNDYTNNPNHIRKYRETKGNQIITRLDWREARKSKYGSI